MRWATCAGRMSGLCRGTSGRYRVAGELSVLGDGAGAVLKRPTMLARDRARRHRPAHTVQVRARHPAATGCSSALQSQILTPVPAVAQRGDAHATAQLGTARDRQLHARRRQLQPPAGERANDCAPVRRPATGPRTSRERRSDAGPERTSNEAWSEAHTQPGARPTRSLERSPNTTLTQAQTRPGAKPKRNPGANPRRAYASSEPRSGTQSDESSSRLDACASPARGSPWASETRT